MRLTPVGIFAEAGALFRRDRDLLLRVAAVFFFLPALGGELFFPWPEPPQDQAAATELLIAWAGANAPWLVGQIVAQLLGIGILLVLLLDSRKPTLGAAMVRALRLLPALMLAWGGVLAIVCSGALLFFVPGLYALGRTFVVSATLVDEPQRGPLGAIVAGIRRTERNGWMLVLVAMALFAAGSLTIAVIDGFGGALGGSGPLRAVFACLDAAVAAAVALGQVLAQVAAYRLLSTKQGI
ncbi:MAG: hypothetical protein WDN44_14950 [Sphingomonas sp.]